MRVLVVGQGGREHALVWKLSQSPKVTEVYCAPGNAGTARDGQNLAISDTDAIELVRFAKKKEVALAVVGPEAPLMEGVSDALRAAGIPVFGPSKDAAILEGSKIFCKELLIKAKVPTANYRIFEEFEMVMRHLEANPGPCVVKADGLAAGKGAIVCKDEREAMEAAHRILVDREFGRAGDRMLIEECLVGQEASVLAITDGKTIAILPPCQDHKPAFDNDEGPNTGGMGAYCPAPILNESHLASIERDVFIPVIHEMRRSKRPFMGVLYAGLMLTPGGPKVLEFNVRFGDPECQPLLARLQTDLFDLLLAASQGRLSEIDIQWDPRPAVCVVMASKGYPGSYPKGLPITGIEFADRMEGVKVFHAGTKRDNDKVVTSGGRVLGVTALGEDIRDAKERAYKAVNIIQFDGAMYRTDIADKAIRA